MKYFLILLTLALCACASQGQHMAQSDFGPVNTSVTTAQQHVASATKAVKSIVTNGAKPNSPEAMQAFQDLNLTSAQLTTATQQLTTLSLDDKTKTEQGNVNADLLATANMKLRDEEAKPARDHKAIFILMALEAAFCIIGPFVLLLTPYTAWVPTKLQAVATGAVGYGILSGITGLLILFGVL